MIGNLFKGLTRRKASIPRGASYSWKRPHCSKRAKFRRLRQAWMGQIDIEAFLNVDHCKLARETFYKIIRQHEAARAKA